MFFQFFSRFFLYIMLLCCNITIMIMLYFWLLVMLGLSMLARALYRLAHTPGYKAAFNLVAFVGVFVHEVAHYTVSTIVGGSPDGIRVKYRSEDKSRVAPHGSVGNPKFKRLSVLQMFAISFAPLLVSTFLLMFCIDVIFNLQTEAWVKVAAFVFSISLVIGSKPSGQDAKLVGQAFQNDPRYSSYQIFLLLFSGALMWFFVDLYVFVLPFEVLYYVGYCVVLFVFYFGLKCIFWTFGKTFQYIAKKLGKTQISSPKFLTRRRRFKYVKDPNEREVQW